MVLMFLLPFSSSVLSCPFRCLALFCLDRAAGVTEMGVSVPDSLRDLQDVFPDVEIRGR